MLLVILLKRMREKIEYELPHEQAGFRRGRSTVDMLIALQVLIEKMIEMDGQAFVGFIDYSKAFDRINQVQMFEMLTKWAFQNTSSLYWKRFTMTSQLSLDGMVATVVHSRLREE